MISWTRDEAIENYNKLKFIHLKEHEEHKLSNSMLRQEIKILREQLKDLRKERKNGKKL